MDATEKILFALLRQRLGEGEQVAVALDAVPALYALAQKHQLAHIIADTPQLMAVEGLPFRERLLQTHYRTERYGHSFGELCQCFQSEKVPFIPLKGMVLQDFYPEKWMRISSDMDIALHPEDMGRAGALLESRLGYRPKAMSDHDISYISADGVRVELHHTLIEDDPVLSDFWSHAAPEDGSRYRLEEPYFYHYHMAHLAKHFRHGGCGIRPLLDLWLMERHGMTPPWPALEQAGLNTFTNACRRLSRCWFDGQPMEDDLREMEAFILQGGLFGSTVNQQLLKKTTGGKPRSLSRIFVPVRELEYTYPILRRHRWMNPVCQLRRWGNLLLGDKARRRRTERQCRRSLTASQIDATAQLLSRLGLQTPKGR
ncbi:MAG: hypothetical protein E7466_02245 [Ruminococcaceae bacterium]|nr:hypothetical protein [Oscillospiraceae bacterium]MBQ3215094.1 nucleotidyltransferase family protein [Oscillospiraceae bacterium]